MIEVKGRYRVRIENALDYSGHCAIETEIEASSRDEALDEIALFMNTYGFASRSQEIKVIDVNGDILWFAVGLHWRVEEFTRAET